MEAAEIDNHGYPTDETLEAIEKWNVIENAQGLFDFVIPIFKDYGRFTFRELDLSDIRRDTIGGIYEVATGGWSGCESAICAMQKNHMFWMVYWRLSQRGGYYEFDKPK